MKTLNFEQMEQVNGGSAYGWVCGISMGFWGTVLAAGLTIASAGMAGVVVGAVWTGLSVGICNMA